MHSMRTCCKWATYFMTLLMTSHFCENSNDSGSSDVMFTNSTGNATTRSFYHDAAQMTKQRHTATCIRCKPSTCRFY